MKPLNQEEKELRDRIAIETMKCLLATHPEWTNSQIMRAHTAERAYQMADDMLKARDKNL